MTNHAKEVFKDTDVSMTSKGRPVLGFPIGTDHFINELVKHRVGAWVTELDTLTKISLSQPQAAYSALTHGVISRWNYLSWTCPNIDPLVQSLENILRHRLPPSLTT